MRATVGAVLAVATVLIASAIVAVSPAAAAEERLVPTEWDVLEVGPAGRSLVLYYSVGGCLGPKARATVTETGTSVTVSVGLETEAPLGTLSLCPAVLGVGSLRVSLAAPLAGRAILGRPTPDRAPAAWVGLVTAKNGRAEHKTPRVIGFSSDDATHALERLGLHEHVRYQRLNGYGLPRVISQRPAPGRIVPQDGAVHVVVGTG